MRITYEERFDYWHDLTADTLIPNIMSSDHAANFQAESVTVAGWMGQRRLERCHRDLADPYHDIVNSMPLTDNDTSPAMGNPSVSERNTSPAAPDLPMPCG